ncbi:hypothetical protein ACJJTC_016644 [Scirpophaga incertulas]
MIAIFKFSSCSYFRLDASQSRLRKSAKGISVPLLNITFVVSVTISDAPGAPIAPVVGPVPDNPDTDAHTAMDVVPPSDASDASESIDSSSSNAASCDNDTSTSSSFDDSDGFTVVTKKSVHLRPATLRRLPPKPRSPTTTILREPARPKPRPLQNPRPPDLALRLPLYLFRIKTAGTAAALANKKNPIYPRLHVRPRRQNNGPYFDRPPQSHSLPSRP